MWRANGLTSGRFTHFPGRYTGRRHRVPRKLALELGDLALGILVDLVLLLQNFVLRPVVAVNVVQGRSSESVDRSFLQG